jgi:hypothetical protein
MIPGSKAHPERYRAAVNLRCASDPARLLRGERADSDRLEDANQWLRIYGELVEFNRQLIEGIQTQLATADSSQYGGPFDDLLLVEAHLQRLQRRYLFWQRRRLELIS